MTSLQLTNLFDVTDKVVVITGGRSGTGRMMTDGFVQNSAKVYIVSRKLDTCKVDLMTKAACKQVAEDIAKRESRVDVLVNNAGMGVVGGIETTPEEGLCATDSTPPLPLTPRLFDAVWTKTLSVNLTAPFHLIHYLLPLLDVAAASPNAARIINVSSIGGFMPQRFDVIAYDTSKGALHHLTRVLVAKLARRPSGGHILVNAIAPGSVPTEMTEPAFSNTHEYLLPALPRNGLLSV